MNSQPDSANHERAIRLFTRRLALLLALKHSLAFITVWCFAWGTVALVMRAIAATPSKPLLWGAAGIAVAIIAAVVISGRHLPSRNSVRALLDLRLSPG